MTLPWFAPVRWDGPLTAPAPPPPPVPPPPPPAGEGHIPAPATPRPPLGINVYSGRCGACGVVHEWPEGLSPRWAALTGGAA